MFFVGFLICIVVYYFVFNNIEIFFEYGFFMVIISIIFVIMCSFLNFFNVVLVCISKKWKYLGSGFDIC